MPDSRVIVVALTEDEADFLREKTGPEQPIRDTAIHFKLRAALDRDRDELVEVIARAIGESGGIEWNNLNGVFKSNCRRKARLALAAIERADQEEGKP